MPLRHQRWPREGGRRIRPVAYLSAALPVAALAVTLASCGSSTPHASGSHASPGTAGHLSSGGSVCAATGQLDSLTVTRKDVFPRNHVKFSFPATVKVGNAAQARAVARQLCALHEPTSRSNHGVAMACPINLGISYNLDFSAQNRQFAPVNVGATGCETVRGLGSVRLAMGSTPLWRTLGTAMKLPHPGNAAFRGSAPSTGGGGAIRSAPGQ